MSNTKSRAGLSALHDGPLRVPDNVVPMVAAGLPAPVDARANAENERQATRDKVWAQLNGRQRDRMTKAGQVVLIAYLDSWEESRAAWGRLTDVEQDTHIARGTAVKFLADGPGHARRAAVVDQVDETAAAAEQPGSPLGLPVYGLR